MQTNDHVAGNLLFSLQAKLFFLIILALGCIAIPLIMFTNREFTRAIQDMEKASLGNVLGLVEENISTKYLNMLMDKVERVMERRNLLRQAATHGSDIWNTLDVSPHFPQRPGDAAEWTHGAAADRFTDRRGLFMDILDAMMSGSGIAMQLYTLKGEMSHHTEPEAVDLAQDGAVDFKGHSLNWIIDNLPPAGDFAVFTRPMRPENKEADHSETLLVFFLPIPAKQAVLAALFPLTDIEREAARALEGIIRSTGDRLEKLRFYENGFIFIIHGERVIIHCGNPAWAQAGILPGGGMDLARRQGAAALEMPVPDAMREKLNIQGAMIFYISYFKALDWHIIAAAPKSEVEAPSSRLLKRQAALSVGITLAILVLTLILAAKLVHPLCLLTRKVGMVPQMDFAAADTDAMFARGLPTERKDEVGELARSFSAMGQALVRNIRDLMETTAIKERMQGELDAARQIQMGILPQNSAAENGSDGRKALPLAALLEPAKEVGGDLYDFFHAPDGRLCLVIGDVSDKGVPAALFMSMTVTLVRYAMHSGLDPATAMSRVNDTLSANNPESMFVTLFIALLEPGGTLEYANGGHCPALIWRGNSADAASSFRILAQKSGPVVGGLGGVSYKLHQDKLEPGEACLLFTDGVTEAMNASQELFGMERLVSLCDGFGISGLDGPEKLIAAVKAAVDDFQGSEPQADDITMLCFFRDSGDLSRF